MLHPLNGSYLIEFDSSGSKTYQLQPLGVLCTTESDHYLPILKRYIAYVRDVYFKNHTQNSVKHDEVMSALQLSVAETTRLGRLLGAGVFWTQPGHAPDYSTWEASLPSGMGDLLENVGSIDAGFEKLLNRHWHPGMKISADERARQLYAGSQTLELLFEATPNGTQKTRRRVRQRVAIPAATETEVLTKCRRRCCVCYGLYGDLETKPGQIAHLDGNHTNAGADNLAWLCLGHHDQLDTRTSQSKGLTSNEVKSFRTELWRAVERNEHFNGRDHPSKPASKVTATPYDLVIDRSPREAVDAAWGDVERSVMGALAGKMSFPDPAAPIPAGALALVLRNYASVDQEHSNLFQQLGHVHQLIADGAPCDQPVAREFCAKATEVTAYLGKK
ncbi:MAG: hypothetical protein EXS37_08730 [Opitutus sp.]|nr:hypothetical protein [Opitutus sp.]